VGQGHGEGRAPGAVEELQARLQQIDLDLDNSVLKAPFTGRIGAGRLMGAWARACSWSCVRTRGRPQPAPDTGAAGGGQAADVGWGAHHPDHDHRFRATDARSHRLPALFPIPAPHSLISRRGLGLPGGGVAQKPLASTIRPEPPDHLKDKRPASWSRSESWWNDLHD